MIHPARLMMVLLVTIGLGVAPAMAQLTVDNFNRAVSGILAAGTRAKQVATLDHVTGISLIKTKWRVGGHTSSHRHGHRSSDSPQPQDIEIAASKHKDGITRLRAALRRNPATRSALAERGIDINRVVAVDIFSNGWLRVYIY